MKMNGKPLANQFVTAGWESQDGKLNMVNAQTDGKGITHFKLAATGKWFVKTMHMEKVSEPRLDYESKWATLTVEIR